VIELADGIGDGVEYVQPVVSSDPDVSFFIFHQCGNGAVGEPGLTEYAVLNKYAAVVAVETTIGADPENAGFILEDALNGVVAEAIFNGEAGELKRALCCCG
jgi:hypothetical protein